jgi:hypothetical protein
VDKSNGRYVAIGAQLDSNDNRLPAPGGSGVGNGVPWFKRRKWEEGKETHILDNTDEGFRRLKEVFGGDENEMSSCLKIKYAVSSLVRGNKTWLREYLDSSSEATLFLQGVDHMGNTALHLAACEGWPEMVGLLLRYNIDINPANAEGRTPLMETALWGRLDNVFLLLQYGANTEATDDQGNSAIDFATPSQKNDDERYDRFEHCLHIYPSKTYDIHRRHTERRQIVSILGERGSKAAVRNSLINDDGIEEFKFVTSLERRSIVLVKEFPVSKTSKVIARLTFPSTRKDKFIPVDAMSGWGHDDNGEDQVVIDGRSWTPEVMKLATFLNYHLRADSEKDHGLRGQYYACHAEKQLIAYFVNNHVVLGEDDWHLRKAIPPIMMQKVQIVVSRKVCQDCKTFLAFVNRVLKLDLQVKEVDNSKLNI